MTLDLAHTPPKATKKPNITTQHGDKRQDDYAWLRDKNWQEVLTNPAVLDDQIRDYLEAENAYTEKVTAPLQELQEKLFAELKGRMPEDDDSPPVPKDDFLYYSRHVKGKQYPLFCRKLKDGGQEEVYFDVNTHASGVEFFKVGAVSISPNHEYFAYTVDTQGSERYELRVYRIADGKLLASRMGVHASFVWSQHLACDTLYYLLVNQHQRADTVKRMRLHLDVSADEMLYKEKDSGMFLSLGLSRTKRFIELGIHNHDCTEVRLCDASRNDTTFKLFARRQKGEEYSVIDDGEGFYILTNRGGATNFKLMYTRGEKTARKNWKTIIRHRKNVYLRDVVVFKNYLARLETKEALPRIIIRQLKDEHEQTLNMPEAAYDLDFGPELPFDGRSLRLTYTSPSTPTTVYDVDMKNGQKTTLKVQEIPSGHNVDDYVVERLYTQARDGASVPITILRHKKTPTDGSAPVWLYGYGAYGIDMPARFSTLRLSLVNRGFIFALAHIRGGSDKGYDWYLDGKLKQKTNTFSDYIAAADKLIAENYTQTGCIYAEGRSAGGMLMGAVTNMRPELFKLVHLGVPFVDVLNTMSDDSLPLTPPEWVEWGNPKDNPEDYELIKSYCPYSNLSKKDYPNILITAGLTDPRVTYWEPAKWLAKLRTVNTADTFALMKMDMGFGHGGASGRFDSLKEYAFEYSVVLATFGKV